VPRIILDFDPPHPDAPAFTTGTPDLVYFLSWAYSARYGASHELSEAAGILRNDLKIDLLPLLTFADRDVEDPADEETLERAWQDAAALARCCEETARALANDNGRLSELIEDYPDLRLNIEELGWIAAWAEERGARIRVTYELEEE
jgi:hypothetical protein